MAKLSEKARFTHCEEHYQLSIHEITRSLGVSSEMIMEIIDEGIVSIQKNEQNELCFDNFAIHRIHMVLRLNRDLGVNLAGGALVLDLLTEIDRLNKLLDRNESNK